VGMQAGRSASGCPQEDCFRQPETGRGASRLHSHAERGNEELFEPGGSAKISFRHSGSANYFWNKMKDAYNSLK
ncbi:MAG: hypothetical protein GY749_06880, partial [Desulfobacteraceae bacterium]|nr:hypothetical protein [Desulfobacteraceae bacterium]